jgi:hypothetical protein
MTWQPRFGNSVSRGRKSRRFGFQSRFPEALERRNLLAIDVMGLDPADDAVAAEVDGNLVLTFGEAVQPGPGAGRILIKNATDDSLVEAMSVSGDRVTFDGNSVVVDPVNDLPVDTPLYVLIDAGAIRTTDTRTGIATIFREDFETLHLIDSPLASDAEFNPAADANQYALTFTGTLVVNEAGEYTFGGNSDDGMWLLIDLNQDGDLTDIGDEVIVDQSTHGNQDRLSTCGIESGVVSCPGAGTDSYDLDAGEYLFQYGYFEQGGGSSGEFFYAKGTLEAFDAAAFALVGDASQGIGVTEEGITATTYKAIDGDTVTYFYARDMADGFIDPAEGFPASAIVPTADVWNTGGTGRFGDNHLVPGVPAVGADMGTDYSPDAPIGWTIDSTPEGREDIPEYANGWTFMDKNFWINQQGNQDRNVYTKGQNVVAIVDPDAFDDFVDINADSNPLETFLVAPVINLTGVSSDSVKINFDSSFRPYSLAPDMNPGMTGLVDVSFDGGTSWTNLLTLDVLTSGPNSTLDRADESVSLDVANPGSGEMLIRFGMVNAGNDWWWAFDNLEVTGEVEGETYDGISDRETWNFTAAQSQGIPGDLNGDGSVNLSDFNILKSNFGKDPATPEEGDIDGNGVVGLSDFNILKSNFGMGAAVEAMSSDDAETDEGLLSLVAEDDLLGIGL